MPTCARWGGRPRPVLIGTRAGTPRRTSRGTVCTVRDARRRPPSGRFLRSFRWGHVRQLDRLRRQPLWPDLIARPRLGGPGGAGPGAAPFTIDLDSTICSETYGLAKEGARHPGYTGARGYHPLLAVAAGTGDVLMARLREGRANTARGAATASLPA